MMRMLAWWGTTRSTSASSIPALDSDASAVEPRVRTAILNVSAPFIFMKCSPAAMVEALGGLAAPAARQPDEVGARRFGRHLDAERSAGLIRGGEHDRPGAVAEEDARGSVGEVGVAAEGFGADHEHVPGHAAGHVGLRGGVSVDEPGARRRQVHRRGALVADGVLDQGRRRRHLVVGRERADDDQIDVVRPEPGSGDGSKPGNRGHAGRRLARPGDAALADTRARDDPFIVGIDHPLEIGVGENLARGVGAPTCQVDT